MIAALSRGNSADICLDNLTLGYDRHPAVHHVHGIIAAGTLLAIVGPNGAGKSTLLKAIAGLLAPLSGHVEVGGGGSRPRIAYLPQLASLDRSFPIDVSDIVASGLWHEARLFRRIGRTGEHAVSHALAAVGLAGFEKRWIGSLSGGQMQRALFARLTLQDAPIVLLDEPFNAVDERTAADLLDIIKGWQADGRTVVAALHDLHIVRDIFPQTLLLAREAVAWGRTDDVLSAANLNAARRMSEVFDKSAHICARNAA